MSVRTENREWTENLFREAYVLLSEFQAMADTALDGDHPCRARVVNWLTRYEGKEAPSDTD
jgi:hypothetical protein